jgi:hypothetical protein
MMQAEAFPKAAESCSSSRQLDEVCEVPNPSRKPTHPSAKQFPAGTSTAAEIKSAKGIL